LNLTNLKNLAPDEEEIVNLQVSKQISEKNFIGKEDMIMMAPSIQTRFAKVVRQFNRDQLKSTC
jgi:peroxiredoxin